jgi:cytochrome P450
VCIGNTFALMELPLVLATITQRFRFSLPPGPPVLPKPLLTLQPNGPIRVKLHAVPASNPIARPVGV